MIARTLPEARQLPARDIIATMPPGNRTKRFAPGVVRLTLDYAAYFALLVGIVLLPWWLKVVCVLAAAGQVGRLFVLAHDAGHNTLTPSYFWNRLLGRLAFLPGFTPFTSWQHAHNHLHHGFLRIRGKDMVWCPWTVEQFRAASRPRRFWYRFQRTTIGMPFYWIVENWFKCHFFPSKGAMKTRRGTLHAERGGVVLFALLLTAALWLVGENFGAESVLSVWQIPLMCQLLPYFLWCYVMATVDLIHHTHPRMVWFADASRWNYFQANVESSTRIYLPLGLHKLFHNILEHTAHHVDPRIPLYNLPDSQQKLKEAFPAAVVEEMLLIRYVWRLFRTCQLYDYEGQRWLRYNGEPSPVW